MMKVLMMMTVNMDPMMMTTTRMMSQMMMMPLLLMMTLTVMMIATATPTMKRMKVMTIVYRMILTMQAKPQEWMLKQSQMKRMLKKKQVTQTQLILSMMNPQPKVQEWNWVDEDQAELDREMEARSIQHATMKGI